MLVLSRKRSEMIRIGNDICIKIIRTGHNSVKIGIEAPRHIRVLRAELCEEYEKKGLKAKEDIFDVGEGDEADLVAVCSDQFPYPHIG